MPWGFDYTIKVNMKNCHAAYALFRQGLLAYYEFSICHILNRKFSCKNKHKKLVLF